jgi:hypothetical protein
MPQCHSSRTPRRRTRDKADYRLTKTMAAQQPCGSDTPERQVGGTPAPNGPNSDCRFNRLHAAAQGQQDQRRRGEQHPGTACSARACGWLQERQQLCRLEQQCDRGGGRRGGCRRAAAPPAACSSATAPPPLPPPPAAAAARPQRYGRPPAPCPAAPAPRRCRGSSSRRPARPGRGWPPSGAACHSCGAGWRCCRRGRGRAAARRQRRRGGRGPCSSWPMP